MSAKKLFLVSGIALAWLLSAWPAAAQPSCTITVPTKVVFGNYGVYTATPVDTTGTVRIRCNAATNSVTVDLDQGNAPSFTPRYMLKAAEQLTYNLYTDAARTTIWGDNTGGTSHYGPTDPPTTNVNITVYGRITALQDVSAGAYTDSVVATVNF